MHARLRVIYISTTLQILPGEADCDVSAGAEGIENVTSTGNSLLLEVLAFQLEMKTHLHLLTEVSKHNKSFVRELIF